MESDASVTPDAGPDVDAAPGSYEAQIVEASCAPNDALAISIQLSRSVDAKTCTPNFFDPTLVVDIYVAGDEIDAPVIFVIDDLAEGAVQVCPGGKDSVYAEVELDADWCEPEGGPITCG